MTTVIRFTCPSCEATYRVPDSLGSRTARCRSCGATFRVPPSIQAMLALPRQPAGGGGSGGPAAAPLARPQPAAAAAAAALPDGMTSASTIDVDIEIEGEPAQPAAAAAAAMAMATETKGATAVLPSGSDSHGEDGAPGANGSARNGTATADSPAGRLAASATAAPAPAASAEPAAAEEARAGGTARRPWNVFAVAGGLLLLVAAFAPWLDAAGTPAGGVFAWPANGVSPWRLAVDGAVPVEVGVVPPPGGVPILARLSMLLVPLLGVWVLGREWGSRARGVPPRATVAVAAVGSLAAVAVTVGLLGSETWEVADDGTLAAAVADALAASDTGGMAAALSALRQHVVFGAGLWLTGTVSLLLAVLFGRR